MLYWVHCSRESPLNGLVSAMLRSHVNDSAKDLPHTVSASVHTAQYV